MEEVVADEDCNNDHSTDLPLDRTHGHEDNDATEVGGGGVYGNLHPLQHDIDRMVEGEGGLLHNSNRRTVGVVNEEEEEEEVLATIQPFHDFASLILHFLLLLLVLRRLYSPTCLYHFQNDLERTVHASPEQSYASRQIYSICSLD